MEVKVLGPQVSASAMELKIGEAAGKLWQALRANGAMSEAQLARAARLPSSLAQQGIGWLAREGKLAFIEDERELKLKLK